MTQQYCYLAPGVSNVCIEPMRNTPASHRIRKIFPDSSPSSSNWPVEAIRAIKAPTLLIIGDSDVVRPEHAVELFRLLGGGVAGDLVGLPRSQLAVLPGTTHVTLVDRAEWLVSMMTRFLDGKPDTASGAQAG